jgi:phosphoglycolate phosphatase-like HAD superfamily hydrolase
VLISDFDGVIVDGMAEYWWSARRAAAQLLPVGSQLPEAVPEAFQQLRPQVHHGWEMPLLAAVIAGYGQPLAAFQSDYAVALAASQQQLGWSQAQLSSALDAVRQQAIATDREAWLKLHRPYPWMLSCLQRLESEGVPWGVLTTKSASFTAELLRSHQLHPLVIYGREDGPKPEVLQRLLAQDASGGPWRFLEDRRLTLEAVRAVPALDGVHCLLATWGYLRPGDDQDLPSGIKLLEPEQLDNPLAQWPEAAIVQAN